MSEHLGVKGYVNYYHNAFNEKGEFCFCRHCKKSTDRALIELHQGIASDWIKVICARCNKTIFTSELEKRRFTKDNKKCFICKKKVASEDCSCVSYSSKPKSKVKYLCSNKCYKIWDKQSNLTCSDKPNSATNQKRFVGKEGR